MTDKQPHPTAWMIRWHEGEYPCSMITELNPNPAEKNETITPLYPHPDPRIAELEGLLREAHETLSSGLESDSELEHEWSKSDRELCKRIEAALKEE